MFDVRLPAVDIVRTRLWRHLRNCGATYTTVGCRVACAVNVYLLLAVVAVCRGDPVLSSGSLTLSRCGCEGGGCRDYEM